MRLACHMHESVHAIDIWSVCEVHRGCVRDGRQTWAEIRSLSTADRNLGLPGLQTVWRLRRRRFQRLRCIYATYFREIDVHGMNPITMAMLAAALMQTHRLIRKVSCVLKARLWCSLENERVPLHR